MLIYIHHMAFINHQSMFSLFYLNRFECMKMIQDGNADMMALDTGQGYFAGRYHNMQPIVAEKYAATGGI